MSALKGAEVSVRRHGANVKCFGAVASSRRITDEVVMALSLICQLFILTEAQLSRFENSFLTSVLSNQCHFRVINKTRELSKRKSSHGNPGTSKKSNFRNKDLSGAVNLAS